MKLIRKKTTNSSAYSSNICVWIFFNYSSFRFKFRFFYTPSEIFSEDIPENKRIKIGGMVLESSVIREKTKISFIVTDYQGSINVEFDGIVPDLFKEGSGVVVLGYLKDKTIIAEEVLAKHDENYMPPSIDIEK